MAAEPRWLTLGEVFRHPRAADRRIRRRERGQGCRLAESAVANPVNLWKYDQANDLLALAVRTGMAIARNHGFNDGNKRTAAVALITFLAINGYDLIMPDDTLLGRMIEGCITSDIAEDQLADHLDPYVFERP